MVHLLMIIINQHHQLQQQKLNQNNNNEINNRSSNELQQSTTIQQQPDIPEQQDVPSPVETINDDDKDNDNNDDENEEEVQDPVVTLRRSTRDRRPNPRYFNPDFVNAENLFYSEFGILSPENSFISTLEFLNGNKNNSFAIALSLLHEDKIDEDNILNGLHPLAFMAKANAEDTPNYYQAMNGPDAEGFYKAMQDEMESLESMDPWEEIPITSVPNGKRVLDSTWVFKRKRYPDGSVRSLKARWCVRGDQQIEGVDFFDTYAPVVAWSTVPLLLILSVTLGLATKQVDYTQAFVQADLDDEVYVRMPRGFEKDGYVYRLKKSVYGLRQSPLKFFTTLKKGLEARGFKNSILDPCLFISKDVICVCFVDDCLFFARNTEAIDQVIDNLQKPCPTAFKLKVESDVAGFLGILMQKQNDGTIELLQTGLIDRIITVTGLASSAAKWTPAEHQRAGFVLFSEISPNFGIICPKFGKIFPNFEKLVQDPKK